jgi:hypothetical protein
MALSSDPSAWRNFRRARISTRPIGRQRKSEKLNMFYGYPRPHLTPCGCSRVAALGLANNCKSDGSVTRSCERCATRVLPVQVQLQGLPSSASRASASF